MISEKRFIEDLKSHTISLSLSLSLSLLPPQEGVYLDSEKIVWQVLQTPLEITINLQDICKAAIKEFFFDFLSTLRFTCLEFQN